MICIRPVFFLYLMSCCNEFKIKICFHFFMSHINMVPTFVLVTYYHYYLIPLYCGVSLKYHTTGTIVWYTTWSHILATDYPVYASNYPFICRTLDKGVIPIWLGQISNLETSQRHPTTIKATSASHHIVFSITPLIHFVYWKQCCL